MAHELSLLLPEIILLAAICAILVADCFMENYPRISFVLSEITLVILFAVILMNFPTNPELVFDGAFISDAVSGVLKLFSILICFWLFYYAQDYLQEHEWFVGEYFILGLFALLGTLIMISAGSLLSLYLGLELMSLSLYAMVAMHRHLATAPEAAVKYFIMGAIGTGFLLYGITLVYGLTGHIDLQSIAQSFSNDSIDSTLLNLALIFILAGIAFKFGAVPFHMWVPDVYHGAPTSVVIYIATISKIAAFAMAFRILANGMLSAYEYWQEILTVIAMLSIVFGNLIAIAQTNLKRMLAYSTIAHMGFVILGVLSLPGSATQAGFADGLFYVISYVLMSLGVFGLIILLGRKGFEADELDDYKGLAEKNPWFAFIMLIFMFSMAGIPPFIGFWAKLYVLKDVIQSDLLWLAVFAVFFSIIGAYYYLRVIKLIYFDKPDSLTAIKGSQAYRFIMSINGLLIVLLGLFPGYLMSLCIQALS